MVRESLILVALYGTFLACYDPNKAPPVDPVYPPAPPFVGDVDEACSNACTNLRRLGCPEGQGAIGGETCERRCIIAMELRSMPLACWAKAEDVAFAKGCGSLRCIR